MSIECSFCSNSKSERYVYTQCEHFVCINCAALRASETLQCCNIKTRLKQKVKAELDHKKLLILRNLQNEYEYERTDLNKMKFGLIEERLRKIDQFENIQEKNFQDDDYNNREQCVNEQMQSTPMNEFYKNPLVLRQPKYELQQSTPIKLVTNTDQEDEIIHTLPQKSSFYPLSQQKKQSSHFNFNSIKKRRQPNLKSQFIPILENKIKTVRQQFQDFYSQLQKMEASIVYQIKIYFEEYVNLIEKQGVDSRNTLPNVLIERQRIEQFLNKFLEKWKINEVRDLLQEQNNKLKEPQQEFPKSEISERIDQVQRGANYPLQRCKVNYPESYNQLDKKEGIHDKLRFSQSLEVQNEIRHPMTSGRNLDKIYRKLQESRSKLQQRIQIHNQFINKRCIQMGSY